MDEEFELLYAEQLAELDQLDDPEYEDYEVPKSKRSLSFQTPTVNRLKSAVGLGSPATLGGLTLNDSLPLTPLDTPSDKKRRSTKRGQDDVFGDLSDDEFELGYPTDTDNVDTDLPSLTPARKRPRIAAPPGIPEVSDLDIEPPVPVLVDNDELIALRIVEERQKKAVDLMKSEANRDTYREQIMDGYDIERQRVHKRIPKTNFTTATNEDGQRVYMALKSDERLQKDQQIKTSSSAPGGSHLLGVSFSRLKETVDQMRLQKVLEESRQLSNDRAESDHEHGSRFAADQSDESSDYDEEDVSKPRQHLWVEKYRPKDYIDLLSEEAINRSLLRWLKLWDHIVFGKPKVKNKKQTDKKTDLQKKFKNQTEFSEYDQYDRPYHKVVLLCGPPGLGKTTLAHVVAKHAGYNVVEINASDDRSLEVFKKKVEAATQMKSVLSQDQRPNCLIIDEIDGSPQPTINMLLNTIKRTEKSVGKNKKKEGGLLRRPIICICNDQYVPSLRPLRQVSLVIIFPQTMAARLAQRLLEVSRIERLQTDLSTLLCLCEKTDNDIRSCLNTLQFIQKRRKELTMAAVQSMNVGQKDSHKTLFEVWRNIFQMPRAKRKRFVNPHDRDEFTDFSEMIGPNNTSLQARFHTSYSIASASGEHEKIMQGLFENYLEVKIKDPHMDGVNLGSDWLCFSDIINRQIGQSQDYILMRYQPYLVVTFHLLFASNTRPTLNYPSSQYECTSKHGKSVGLVEAMMEEMLPSVRSYLNIERIVLDTLPPLMEIIQPPLRPVNTQLYSSKEKSDLSRLIKIMIAYNMSYNQERQQDETYNYVLDPNLDEVVYFPGLKQHQTLTYAAKQLVSREIEVEKMRRTDRSGPRFDTPRPKMNVDKKPSSGSLPNHLQRLHPKAVKVTEIVPVRDFFGRVIKIKKKTPETIAKEKKKNILSSDIWFCFKEGFSNAVRKPVKVQDML